MSETDAVARLVSRLRAQDRWLGTGLRDEDVDGAAALIEAAATLAAFTGHNPYCKLEYDRLACDQMKEESDTRG